MQEETKECLDKLGAAVAFERGKQIKAGKVSTLASQKYSLLA